MALINCPQCNEKISDKVKECPSCGLDIGNLSEESLASLGRQKKIKKMARITTESFFAILLFAGGFTWLYWREPSYQSVEMYASYAAVWLGVIWYLVNRVRLILVKRK